MDWSVRDRYLSRQVSLDWISRPSSGGISLRHYDPVSRCQLQSAHALCVEPSSYRLPPGTPRMVEERTPCSTRAAGFLYSALTTRTHQRQLTHPHGIGHTSNHHLLRKLLDVSFSGIDD